MRKIVRLTCSIAGCDLGYRAEDEDGTLIRGYTYGCSHGPYADHSEHPGDLRAPSFRLRVTRGGVVRDR